jgi:hypothetical protein
MVYSCNFDTSLLLDFFSFFAFFFSLVLSKEGFLLSFLLSLFLLMLCSPL